MDTFPVPGPGRPGDHKWDHPRPGFLGGSNKWDHPTMGFLGRSNKWDHPTMGFLGGGGDRTGFWRPVFNLKKKLGELSHFFFPASRKLHMMVSRCPNAWSFPTPTSCWSTGSGKNKPTWSTFPWRTVSTILILLTFTLTASGNLFRICITNSQRRMSTDTTSTPSTCFRRKSRRDWLKLSSAVPRRVIDPCIQPMMWEQRGNISISHAKLYRSIE